MNENKVKVPKGTDIESAGKGVLFTVIGGVLAVATVYGITKLYQSSREEEKKKKAFDEILTQGTPAFYANKIWVAIKGMGTDEDSIVAAFEAIPTKRFFAQVISAYSDLTEGDDLNEDLKDDLSDGELQQVIAILNAKPD